MMHIEGAPQRLAISILMAPSTLIETKKCSKRMDDGDKAFVAYLSAVKNDNSRQRLEKLNRNQMRHYCNPNRSVEEIAL
jgi:hypothetical protein